MSTAGISLFEKIIVGTFINDEQVKLEKEEGKQIHPLAKHVTEIINHRIDNLPDDFNGTFILEESYYEYPGKEMEIKPLFFRVTPNGEFDIYLESIVIPDDLDKSDVVNSNPDLRFDFNKLVSNPMFKKATYHNMGDHFIVNHPCDFGNGVSFNLIETLKEGELNVMELAVKDGLQLTPYNTAIIYKKK